MLASIRLGFSIPCSFTSFARDLSLLFHTHSTMRFFGAFALVATLASSVFVAAAPAPVAAVPAIVAREPAPIAVADALAVRTDGGCDCNNVKDILLDLQVKVKIQLDILGKDFSSRAQDCTLNDFHTAALKVITYDGIKGPCDQLTIDIKAAITLILSLKARVELDLLGVGYISLCGILADLVFVSRTFIQFLSISNIHYFFSSSSKSSLQSWS
jgi:hypothetical protein